MLRERFLELRRLRARNASSDPWWMRGYEGYEQGAEVLAWGLGEPIITPSIADNDFEQLAVRSSPDWQGAASWGMDRLLARRPASRCGYRPRGPGCPPC